MKLFYSVLFYLLTPIILLRLYWRGFKAPEYRNRWMERLAIYTQTYPTQVIWIHAVSVGEIEAVFPLIKQLQQQYPQDNFLITTTTPTGSARVTQVLGDTVSHVYLPYDLPCVVNRFIQHFQPKIAVIMEKEIWVNLYACCHKNQIPLMIINARLSAKSAKGYQKITALIEPALKNVTWVLTQTTEDQARFIEIGTPPLQTQTVGNLKFDVRIAAETIQQAQQIRQHTFAGRFVWIIASTHAGEEQIFFEIYSQLKQHIPELLLLVVPRHPERFQAVQLLAETQQLKTLCRSEGSVCDDSIDVYLADTMGELKCLYGTADLCFVGGSMVPVGGHNILEAAAMGTPILFGSYMVNFKEIAHNVLSSGAAIQCEDQQALIDTVMDLYHYPEKRQILSDKAHVFIKANQGATQTTAELIITLISH